MKRINIHRTLYSNTHAEVPLTKEVKMISLPNTLRSFYEKGIPVGIYLFKVYNRNTGTRCKICSKLTIKTAERRQWRLSDVFIVNCEHISHLVLVFLLLTLSKQMPTGVSTHSLKAGSNLNIDEAYNSLNYDLVATYSLLLKSFFSC